MVSPHSFVFSPLIWIDNLIDPFFPFTPTLTHPVKTGNFRVLERAPDSRVSEGDGNPDSPRPVRQAKADQAYEEQPQEKVLGRDLPRCETLLPQWNPSRKVSLFTKRHFSPLPPFSPTTFVSSLPKVSLSPFDQCTVGQISQKWDLMLPKIISTSTSTEFQH